MMVPVYKNIIFETYVIDSFNTESSELSTLLNEKFNEGFYILDKVGHLIILRKDMIKNDDGSFKVVNRKEYQDGVKRL